MSNLIGVSAICFLAALVTSQQNNIEPLNASQQTTDQNSRIVGGQIVADRANFPFQVSLRTVRNNNPFCGGAILNPMHVVTAAQCVVDTNGNIVGASTIQAVVGDLITTATTNTTVVERIAHIFAHDAYNFITHQNDIAVLRVTKSIGYQARFVLTPVGGYDNDRSSSYAPVKYDSICLYVTKLYEELQNNLTFNSYVAAIARAQVTPVPGAFGTVSGWGTIFPGGPASQSLRYVNVLTIDAAVCLQTQPNAMFPGMICAGNYRMGACNDDYGGPLVFDNQLLGLVSIPACGSPDYPGIYTEIAFYNTWINIQLVADTSSALSLNVLLISLSVFLSILICKI